MTTIRAASNFNVEASLNASFNAVLATFSYPTWLTQPPIAWDMPHETPTLPCFSIHHIGVSSDNDGHDGTYAVTRDTALMEINCWATRTNNANWSAQLRTMTDIVKTWRALNRGGVIVKDYAASQSAPQNTSYLVRFVEDARVVDTQPDTNPAIERRRVLIPYVWHFRA